MTMHTPSIAAAPEAEPEEIPSVVLRIAPDGKTCTATNHGRRPINLVGIDEAGGTRVQALLPPGVAVELPEAQP